MSAFNKSRFNLAQFNQQPEGALWLSGAFVERTNCIITTSSTSYYQLISNESVNNTGIEYGKGHMFAASCSESINQVSPMQAKAFFRMGAAETVTQTSKYISQIALAGGSSSETVNTDPAFYISSVSRLVEEFAENVGTGEGDDFHISKWFYTGAQSYEIIDGNVHAEAFSEYVCDLSNIILPPDGVLVIDADNYNLLLNKENVIYEQSGDWLDDLNRSTTNIKIIADQPENLMATILYTERYL